MPDQFPLIAAVVVAPTLASYQGDFVLISKKKKDNLHTEENKLHLRTRRGCRWRGGLFKAWEIHREKFISSHNLRRCW